MKYLVSVERPCGSDERTIVVTNDTEGFGPGLLAIFPISTVKADTPEMAGYRYARQHGITHTLIIINLTDNSDEWWMEKGQAHKIDLDTGSIWEPKGAPWIH